MVMNYGLIDTYLHMSNHYKLINSAKSVVNTSPPKSFILKNKKQSSSSPSTRYSTPTLLSKNDRLPSRTSSHYEFGRRNIKIHNCLQNDLPPRAVSASSQKYSRKLSTTTWNTNFLKNKQHFTTKNDAKSAKSKASVTTNNSSARVSRESSSYSKPEEKHVSYDPPKISKTPVPTPRKKIQSNKTIIPNYEYIQFSLRITEDIIRNDLYNPVEMQRVFNSHLEANRGRLDMTKMLQQIDHLCKELSITANVSSTESDPTKSSELTLRHNSKLLLDKIANRQYEMSSEEIRNLSGTELQNIITGILDYENKDKVPIAINFQSNDNLTNNKDIEPELLELKQKNTTTSDESTKYFDISVKHSETQHNEPKKENTCTDLIPVSLVSSENNKPKTSNIENKTILITSDEIETSVKVSQNTQNKDITIINLEVNQLHNDLIEINKNLTEGFHHLKEKTIIENPVKETSDENEVSIKKHEITQTPFSKEIAQFFDKFPENLTKPTQKSVTENKDMLHFVGITEKVEIENITETYKQINIYDPIIVTEEEEEISNSEININPREIESNFISTVNNLILDGINDLFEPIASNKDIILPHISTSDYFKYENKTHKQEYIKEKYKLPRFSNYCEPMNIKSKTSSQKSSEISLSEGEILFRSKPKKIKENPNILRVLEKYECRTKSYDQNSINKYQLNKFELNYDSSMRNVHFFHSSTTTSTTPTQITSSKNCRNSRRECLLLSDGEVKYSSSDSDDCKTDFSIDSFKV